MFELLILIFVLIFGIQLAFFILAATFKTDKFTDLAYGSTFIFVIVFLFLFFSKQGLIPFLITLLISVWGIRLAVYLFIRIIKTKKDTRFDKIRENFIKFGLFWLFQAVTIWIILLPVIVVLTNKNLDNISILSMFGFAIWIVGFIIETIADQQKFNFKSNINNKNKWIQNGIWKYSRHPNYFGEILVWWGIFIICLPFLSGFYYLTIISPIFITFLLLFISGIPTIEKKYNEKYKNNPDYQSYKKNTSILIPFFVRRLKS